MCQSRGPSTPTGHGANSPAVAPVQDLTGYRSKAETTRDLGRWFGGCGVRGRVGGRGAERTQPSGNRAAWGWGWRVVATHPVPTLGCCARQDSPRQCALSLPAGGDVGGTQAPVTAAIFTTTHEGGRQTLRGRSHRSGFTEPEQRGLEWGGVGGFLRGFWTGSHQPSTGTLVYGDQGTAQGTEGTLSSPCRLGADSAVESEGPSWSPSPEGRSDDRAGGSQEQAAGRRAALSCSDPAQRLWGSHGVVCVQFQGTG